MQKDEIVTVEITLRRQDIDTLEQISAGKLWVYPPLAVIAISLLSVALGFVIGFVILVVAGA